MSVGGRDQETGEEALIAQMADDTVGMSIAAEEAMRRDQVLHMF